MNGEITTEGRERILEEGKYYKVRFKNENIPGVKESVLRAKLVKVYDVEEENYKGKVYHFKKDNIIGLIELFEREIISFEEIK